MKIGKTTLAVKFPRNLLLGFEHGWNAISGARAVDMTKWADFKKAIKQLQSDKAKEMYDSISLDNIGLAYEMCTDYICSQESVDRIGDVPYGAGYKMVDKEFDRMVRSITQMGYGIVIIAHAKSRIETDGSCSVKHIYPDIPDRCSAIINRMVDLTAYIGMEEDGKRYIYPRATRLEENNGKQIVDIFAGSHFAYLNDKIGLSYEALTEAIASAIEEDAANGGVVVDTPVMPTPQVEQLDFKAIRAEIGNYAKVFKTVDDNNDEAKHVPAYRKICEEYLGKGRLVKDCTEDQVDHLALILEDIKDYAEENNIKV